MFNYVDFAMAYEDILRELVLDPEYITSPRGMKIHEDMNVCFTINNPQSCLFTNKVRDLPLDYLAKEICLYFSGTNELKYFKKASSFWEKIANTDGTVNSAYGNLIFNNHFSDHNNTSQFSWAMHSLVNDIDSRQAIMHFNRPCHCDVIAKDFPCTIYGIFHIRENKLNFKVSMRSNDIFLGATFDIPFFCILQMVMLDSLKESAYPDLKLGTYTHNADSLHLYERNFEIAKEMLQHEFKPREIPMPMHSIIKHPELLEIFNTLTYTNSKYDLYDMHPFLVWLTDNI